MLTLKSKWVTLLAGLALGATVAAAQDNKALIDTLIRKGVLTSDEAAQIESEAASAAKSAAKSLPETRISGKMYIDISSIDAETANGTKVNPSGTGLDVKRFYLDVFHQFNSVWAADIKTDAGYSSAAGAVTPFLKTAYLQAKLSPYAIVQAGSADMPWIPFVEDAYGFRYVENTLTDRLHFANSADWGLHMKGGDSLFNYSVAVVNGGGYKNSSRSKTMDYAGRVGVTPVKGLTLAVGAYDGKLGKDSYSAASRRTATRYDALVAYVSSGYRVGGEYFSESDWGYTGSALSDKGDGYAVWGSLSLGSPFSVFGRYDSDKPSKKLHPDMKDQYFNAGIQYQAIKGVDLSLVYKHDHIDNPSSASQVTKYDEIGVFSQVAF